MKKIPSRRAYIEETHSSGILSIRSPVTKVANSIARTTRRSSILKPDSIGSPLMRPDITEKPVAKKRQVPDASGI